jgi:hypothetical protein
MKAGRTIEVRGTMKLGQTRMTVGWRTTHIYLARFSGIPLKVIKDSAILESVNALQH